jgi:DNA-binding transcriptional regulator YdaS (Cro superfamily)
MSTDEQLISLIEKAGAIAGSEYKLAKLLGVPQTVLTDWKAGRRTCTPGDRARVAGFAQESALQELVRSTINSAKGLKREQLEQLLGKQLRAIGGGLHSVLAVSLSAIFGTTLFDVPRCIKRVVL